MFALHYFITLSTVKQFTFKLTNNLVNNLLLRRAAETPQGSVYHLDSPLEILCTTVLARVH